MLALNLASCKLSTRKPDARRLCKRANMRSPRGPARKAIVLKCNNVVTKMHTKERKPREEEEDDDGFWQLLLHAKCHARTCSARRLDICSELPLLQHELSSRRQCCLCIRLEHLQLKRYNKRSLDHNKHAVAAESLLLLKSASAHSPTAIDPVHTKPSDQPTSAPDLHRDVLLALERWPDRLVAPGQSQQVDAVAVPHHFPWSPPAAVLPAKSPSEQRKLRAEARLTPEAATNLRLTALVRTSRAGPTSGCSSPLGERDYSPATVMSIGMGGVTSPLANPRRSGTKTPLSMKMRGASRDCVISTEVGNVSSPRATSTKTLPCAPKFVPDRVAPKDAATPPTMAAPRTIAAPRAGAMTPARAAPLHGGGQGCGGVVLALKRTRAPQDTGDAARPPREPRLQPPFIDAPQKPVIALDTLAQLSPIDQAISSPQVVSSFFPFVCPRPLPGKCRWGCEDDR